LQRHADQLHLVSGHAAQGGSLEGALFKARGLPRGGPVRQRFERHVRSWPLPRLSAALQAILTAERDCKSTGYPDEVIARRLCLALASSVRSARSAR
jgi:DNA polymerase-3 subunit delta